jgi:hypothetical protein
MDLEAFKEVIQKVKSPPAFCFRTRPHPNDGNHNRYSKAVSHRLTGKIYPVSSEFWRRLFWVHKYLLFRPRQLFFIFNRNPATVNDLLFMSDNGCGDYYAFHVEGGRCSEKILFCDHEDNTVRDTGFSDVFEYLVKTGLNRQS